MAISADSVFTLDINFLLRTYFNYFGALGGVGPSPGPEHMCRPVAWAVMVAIVEPQRFLTVSVIS